LVGAVPIALKVSHLATVQPLKRHENQEWHHEEHGLVPAALMGEHQGAQLLNRRKTPLTV
jgi:hypothetical protein